MTKNPIIIQPLFGRAKSVCFQALPERLCPRKKFAKASSTAGDQMNRLVGGKKHEVPRRLDYSKGLGSEPRRKIKTKGNLVAGRSAVTALYV